MAIQPEAQSAASSAAQVALQHGQFQLSSAQEVLKQTSEMYDKVTDQQVKASQELQDLLEEMSKLNVKEIDFKKITEILRRGILAFQNLREKWAKLVEFFQMTSNLIEMCLKESLDSFLKFAETARNRELEGYTPDQFTKDKIYKLAIEGAKICHLVNLISETYVEVSNKHLMHRIAGVGNILGYDINTEEHLITKEQKNLLHQCQEAQADIQREIIERKEQFHIKIKRRLAVLKEVEPIEDTEDKRRIQKAVKAGKEEAKQVVETPVTKIEVNVASLY